MKNSIFKFLVYRFKINKHLCGIIFFICGTIVILNSLICIPDYTVGWLFIVSGGYLFVK